MVARHDVCAAARVGIRAAHAYPQVSHDDEREENEYAASFPSVDRAAAGEH